MPTAYVYAPHTGNILGQEYYCNGNPHTHVRPQEGFDDPLDIGGSGGTVLRFYATTLYVKSIRTRRVGWICQDTTLIPYTYGVVATLYANTAGNQYIGEVMYGHLQDSGRVADGLYTNFYSLQIGKIIGTTCGTCSCYPAQHIHVEHKNGVRRDFSCCTCVGYQVSRETSWIFKFTVYPQ
jgi:hypothetical protein